MEKMQIPKAVVTAILSEPHANVVVKARNIQAEVSELPEFGGSGNALTPLEYMLASLASCEAFMFGMISNLLTKAHPHVEITVEGEFEVGKGLKSIRIVYRISGIGKSEATILLRHVRSSCPIYNTLIKACENVTEELVAGDASE